MTVSTTVALGASTPDDQCLHLQRCADRHRGQPEQRPPAGGTSVMVTGTGFVSGPTRSTSAPRRAPRSACQRHHAHGQRPGGDRHGRVTVSTTPVVLDRPGQLTVHLQRRCRQSPRVSPSGGPTGGGTSVTVTGTNFTGATAVDFGFESGRLNQRAQFDPPHRHFATRLGNSERERDNPQRHRHKGLGVHVRACPDDHLGKPVGGFDFGRHRCHHRRHQPGVAKRGRHRWQRRHRDRE